MSFLTPDELHRLTGYKRPSRQASWLRSRRIRHWINAAGHPVVRWSALDGDGEVVAMPQRPNLAAVKGVA